MVRELTDAEEQEIVCQMEARREITPKAIARRMGLSVRTVYRVWKRKGARWRQSQDAPVPSRDDVQ